MTWLATEFPIKPTSNPAAFVEQVVTWLRGTRYSKIFDSSDQAILNGDNAHLISPNGEELRLREFSTELGLLSIGFRYDFPDELGRLWRTEAVVKKHASGAGQDLIRLRTECVARFPGVRLDPPRKPYFIKMLMSDGWGGNDGQLEIADTPIFLSDDAAGLQIAYAVTLGQATQHLPVIYVSSTDNRNALVTRDQIRKLAFDLGGIAHVVVEPSRKFSFKLRDLTAGRNGYGGALVVALPGQGIIRRFSPGFRFPDNESLIKATRDAAIHLRNHMPSGGWDWTELQEQALRQQRERESNRPSSDDKDRLYEEEISNLEDKIRQMQIEIRSASEREPDQDSPTLDFLAHAGLELYQGEFIDRIRLAAKECCLQSDRLGIDTRTLAVLDAISTSTPTSNALIELLEDLKRATRDPRRIAAELTSLMSRHGYDEKSDNKHIRLEAKPGFIGLDSVTLPKTPSEKRGLTNLRKQIERTLGLTKLL